MSRATKATALGPGIHRGVPMTDYLVHPAIGATGLERLRRSPLQYRHALAAADEASPAKRLGTAVHTALLEPHLFAARYVVAESCAQPLASGNRKGKPCGNPGLFLHADLGWLCGVHVKGCGSGVRTDVEVLAPQAHADVMGMRDSIRAHPRARTLFGGRGEFEVTIIFDDPIVGVRCKIRPDRLVRRAGLYVALKTTRDAAPWAFAVDAERRGYFRSLALYRRGLRAVGWPYRSATVVAIESAAPYDLVPYLAREPDIDAADHEVTRLLTTYRTCAEMDRWPGYAVEFQPLYRPTWAMKQAEEERDDG